MTSRQHYFCRLSATQKWEWAGMRVRCALFPDEPRVLLQYLGMGDWLSEQCHLPAWEVALRQAELLLGTAADPELPMPWRCLCMDHLHRPLGQLTQLADTPARILLLQHLSACFATLDPSAADNYPNGDAS